MLNDKAFSEISLEEVDAVDLTATFKGKLSFQGEKGAFSGILKSAEGTKARLEFFDPLGRTAGVFLLSDGKLSLFLAPDKALYRGRATPENLSKLFGVECDPFYLLKAVTGLQPFQKIRELEYSSPVTRGGSYSLIEYNQSCFPPPCRTVLKIVYAYRKKGAFMSRRSSCPLIVPSRLSISGRDFSVLLEISIEKILSLSLFAKGRLVASYAEKRSEAGRQRTKEEPDIYSDAPLAEIPGVAIIELESLSRGQPLLSGSLP